MDQRIGSIFRVIGMAVVGWLAFTGIVVHLMWFASASHNMGGKDIMSDINLVEIVGRLGRDPNEHHTDNGFAIAGMSVATNRSWKDKKSGEWQKRTDWHQVSAFGKQAEWCISELKKGTRVRVVGRLQTDVVEDKYGQKKYYTKIIAQDIGLE